MVALAVSKGVLEECPNEECEGINPVDAAECATCGRKLEEEEEEEPETTVVAVEPHAAPVATPTTEI
jgi:hypothetical protein